MSATASVPAVFITVPKYVAITPSPLPKIRPTPTRIPVSADDDGSVHDDSTATRGKKRRLDHLTWEEKIQRKKLKNRVAAQTSRDRKKARMEEMEHEIDTLTQKTELLQNKCESLQAINDSLLEKNQKLDMEVELLRQQVNEMQQKQQSSKSVGTCAGCESILNGSAVSNTDPLQQGSSQMDSQSTRDQLKKTSSLAALWKIVALCLLYKTCSSSTTKTSMPESWKNLLRVYSPISQPTWRQVIDNAMKLLPKLQAEQSDCLDQWWGPQQSAWNPANIASSQPSHEVAADEKTTATIATTTTTPPPPQSLPLTEANATLHSITPDTVYGTYDAKTNSITIHLEDDVVSVNEAVEEIYCDGIVPPANDEDCIKCPTPLTSPSQVYLNVDTCTDDEQDDDDEDANLDFDPIKQFLRPKQPLLSPLAKSPALSLHSAISDHGYESVMGSPPSMASDHFEPDIEDFPWNNSFNDLFPNLI